MHEGASFPEQSRLIQRCPVLKLTYALTVAYVSLRV